ncbi:uncharacterized protein LOC131012493 [Salvia miltiorrhiza]|uniref:uncharacterized protein LOC131012493 n=1 Tax=Salvia miltiorrhiza TaxID=226208 RepID=UPI0025AC2041|nr:uncharacterized protein LOC131012493 [Salvia miltiorrhiza]XP_057796463.1 uncharacterized protein LOC131012493 [Salvia miltiorrhiza]
MKWNSDSDWIIEKPSFKSRIIMNNAKYWKDMSRRQKDIADFCFHEHRPMNTSNVFKHDLHCWRFVVDFNGIRSLNEGVFIDTIVIDAWALILNKSVQYHNAQNSYLTRKFYFNTQHSSYLQGMLRATDPAVIDRMGYNARSCWHFSMKQMLQLNDLKNIQFFFIPICVNNHFIAVVVNFEHRKIQYLDNILGNCEEDSDVWKLLDIVKNQFSISLLDMEHPKALDMEYFPIEDVPFDWKSAKTNIDCGVFLMHHMEFFNGYPYISPNLLQGPQRRKLRAEYCSRIILSDLNQCRDEILSEIFKFAKRKK